MTIRHLQQLPNVFARFFSTETMTVCAFFIDVGMVDVIVLRERPGLLEFTVTVTGRRPRI